MSTLSKVWRKARNGSGAFVGGVGAVAICALLMGVVSCEKPAEVGPEVEPAPVVEEQESAADVEELEESAPREEGGQVMSLTLSSAAFENGEMSPRKYTGQGPDVSPSLQWTEPPAGTKSFALICDDPDAPMGTWVHWVIYGIPADARELPEAVPKRQTLTNGAKQGTTDLGDVGYGGPMPPPGKDHRYFFKLYALDTDVALAPGARKKDLLKTMEGHILAQAELMGKYRR